MCARECSQALENSCRCIHTSVDAGIVYTLDDNTGEMYIRDVYIYAQCMTCILPHMYSIPVCSEDACSQHHTG